MIGEAVWVRVVDRTQVEGREDLLVPTEVEGNLRPVWHLERTLVVDATLERFLFLLVAARLQRHVAKLDATHLVRLGGDFGEAPLDGF